MNQRTTTNRGPRSERGWLWLGGFVVVLLTIAAHSGGLHGQFLDWDDTTHVTQNPAIRALAPDNLRVMFTDYTAKLYIPLTWFSFAIDYQIWGRDPFGYHFTNLVLHLANTVLVLLFVYRIFVRRLAGSQNRAAAIAVLTAAIFGVHPLRVESVAWITERKDVLFAFFFLLALHAYLTWVTCGKRSAYWCCFGLFAASVLSKPTAVTFPLVTLLLDYFWIRRVALREKIPFFLLSALATASTIAAQASGTGQTLLPPEAIPLWARAGLVGYCALFHVQKFFWPFHLSAIYPTFDEMDWAPLVALGYLLAFLAVFAAVVALRHRAPVLLPSWLFFLVTLLPTIGLVPVGIHIVADRFSYMPLLGLAVPFSVGAVTLAARNRNIAWGVGAAVVATLLSLTVLSVQRTAVWADTETLFQDVLKKNPRCYPALVNLTVYYTSGGRFDEAIAHGQRAVEVAPNGLIGRKNLARALIRAGRHREAVAILRPAVEHGTADHDVWRALYESFTALGDEKNAAVAKRRLERHDDALLTAPQQTQN
jgi:hypothetical protein